MAETNTPLCAALPAPPQVRQLRDTLSTSQQRATAAEAKVELLQEAVRKAEERAARLEMERNTRAAAPDAREGGGAGYGGAAPAAAAAARSREAELAAEVKLLREELAIAQETAAAATGHAKQFEMLAKTSEEALKSVQADHERFKAEAAARFNAANDEVERLRGELAAREGEVREAKAAEKEFAAECERLDNEFTAQLQKLKVGGAVDQPAAVA